IRSVDLLGERIAAVRYVAGDGVRVGRVDLADFLQRTLIVEVQMLESDQKGVAVRFQGAPHRQSQQSDERSRLLVATVFGKAGDNVADRRMEWICFTDAFDESLGRARNGVNPLRLL